MLSPLRKKLRKNLRRPNRIMANKRDYKEEYKYHQTPAQKKRRAGRNKARRTALAKGKVKKGDNKDVHHKDGNPKQQQAVATLLLLAVRRIAASTGSHNLYEFNALDS